ncbi:hypothetical protein ACFT2C_00610 [Promicromonospora sp. NPDC057138]|uniref:hypothetical protein n=1 Tax=Promicromonospora sp. NPDC057138 TaxID=3346031 RepID=UPI00362972F6
MNLTRAARSPLADPRRGFASVLTVMFLVLAVLGVQAACGVHLDEAGHGSAAAYGAVGQHALPDAATASDQAAQADPEHPGEDPNVCADDSTVTARHDRTLSPSTDLAGGPSLALQWLVPDMAHHGPRVPAGSAVAAAPSLHALGISRT